MFREPEHLRAICEEGRAPLPQIQAPSVHFRERGDQPRGRRSFLSGEPHDFTQQIDVRELSVFNEVLVHAWMYSMAISATPSARTATL
jgi:hypothetical protein